MFTGTLPYASTGTSFPAQMIDFRCRLPENLRVPVVKICAREKIGTEHLQSISFGERDLVGSFS